MVIGSFTGQLYAQTLTYPVVDTGQVRFYDNRDETGQPNNDKSYYGQDAHYTINAPKYRDNGDGTVSDLVTGLMWQKDPGEKKNLKEAFEEAKRCHLGGYEDWRLPSIKELYSLIQFSGVDPDPRGRNTSNLKPL